MRVAVIGHVEWIEFARVEHVPSPGEIVHTLETWEEPGGAGAVAAVQLVKLAGKATLYTALGDDELGHRARSSLEGHGVRVETTFRPVPQRRGFTYIDANGERTITTIGERLGPGGDDPLAWGELEGADAVYFVAGDGGALQVGRAARVLVATSRVLKDLAEAHVRLDAVVGSGRDVDERYQPGLLDPPPGVVVLTRGADGGSWSMPGGRSGTFPAASLPGPVVDAYGCGDSFAAGFAFGLGAGLALGGALELGARCGAACMTGRGPFEGQLTVEGAADLLRGSARIS
jgi:ribokinase